MFLRLIIFLLIFSINLLNGSYINDEKDKESSEKGISASAKIDAQYVITARIKGDVHATRRQMETIKTVMRDRLDYQGLFDAEITEGEDGEIIIGFPEIPENPDYIKEAICSKSRLSFRDYEGTLLMEGTEEFLRDAQMQYGQTNSYGEAEYFVSLTLTPKGQEVLKSATETVLGYEPGNNFVSIYLDETEVSRPVVSAVIDSDSCMISGNFTKESANLLAAHIRSGMLPFELVCD